MQVLLIRLLMAPIKVLRRQNARTEGLRTLVANGTVTKNEKFYQ